MNDPQFYRATLAIFGSNQNEVISTNSADGNSYLGVLDFLILHSLEEDYIPKIKDPDERVNEYVYSKSYIGQGIEICVFTEAHRDFLGLL
ncbi:MAG: hypothetical protein IIB81_03910, partial [Nanoarchaeota archaeon]|nr:hypothetical protein [Nanoarchaeota archaeon]